ncbi:MAG: hypothetical protein ACJ8GN_19410 [Longimicrobiaceae bacterium]
MTIGTGPWYFGSLVLLHEACHAAHDLLGLTRARRARYRLPDGRSGVSLRHRCHDGDFHDLLRRAACQAYGLDGARVNERYAAAGGARRAYSMDAALREALTEKFGQAAAATSSSPWPQQA